MDEAGSVCLHASCTQCSGWQLLAPPFSVFSIFYFILFFFLGCKRRDKTQQPTTTSAVQHLSYLKCFLSHFGFANWTKTAWTAPVNVNVNVNVSVYYLNFAAMFFGCWKS